jgi:hypothetical protein
LADALAKLHPDMSRELIHDVPHDVMNDTKQAMSSSQQLTKCLNAAMVDIEEIKADIEDSKKNKQK